MGFPLTPQPVCLSELFCHEGGREPVPFGVLRTLPEASLPTLAGKRLGAQGCPAHLVGKSFKPEFFWGLEKLLPGHRPLGQAPQRVPPGSGGAGQPLPRHCPILSWTVQVTQELRHSIDVS